jgi:hypothetical protein
MKIYLNLRQLPELQNLTVEQRRGVQRQFIGDRFFLFAGLAGGIGFCIALILSDVFSLSHWARECLGAGFGVCGFLAFCHYELNRLRPNIAKYVFVYFASKGEGLSALGKSI